MPFPHDIQVLTYFMYSYFADIDVTFPKAPEEKWELAFQVEGCVILKYFKKSEMLQVDWETSPKNDLIADSVCLLVL